MGTVHTKAEGWAQYIPRHRKGHSTRLGAGLGTVHAQAQGWEQYMLRRRSWAQYTPRRQGGHRTCCGAEVGTVHTHSGAGAVREYTKAQGAVQCTLR